MYSRIGCCVAYEELSTEQKQSIVRNWYESILSSLKDDEKEEIQKTDILDWFIKNAERYDNIRILKTKLENAVFDRLSEAFIISWPWQHNGNKKSESLYYLNNGNNADNRAKSHKQIRLEYVWRERVGVIFWNSEPVVAQRFYGFISLFW